MTDKRPRLTWTPERMAELKGHLSFQRTCKEIGALMGVSTNAVRQKIHKAGLARPDLKGYRVWLHLKGTKRPKSVRAAVGKAARDRWADPEWRAKNMARLADPQAIAKRLENHRAAMDRKRGFSIPDHMLERYQELRRKSKLSAKDAAALLGIQIEPAKRRMAAPALERAA